MASVTRRILKENTQATKINHLKKLKMKFPGSVLILPK
jgi:hypothetical protein